MSLLDDARKTAERAMDLLAAPGTSRADAMSYLTMVYMSGAIETARLIVDAMDRADPAAYKETLDQVTTAGDISVKSILAMSKKGRES